MRTADLLTGHLAAHGIAAERLYNNVYARAAHFDAAKPTLLLNSHHDTVRPTAAWTRDPFAATWEGERLYGLGANDAGVSVAALTAAFRHYYDAELPFNLLLALSGEEECMGAVAENRELPQRRVFRVVLALLHGRTARVVQLRGRLLKIEEMPLVTDILVAGAQKRCGSFISVARYSSRVYH